MDEAERLEPGDVDGWSDWLARHHASARGVWLVTPRSAAARATLDYETAVTEALRYGWVDSTTRTLDAERSMMWFSPRSPYQRMGQQQQASDRTAAGRGADGAGG